MEKSKSRITNQDSSGTDGERAQRVRWVLHKEESDSLLTFEISGLNDEGLEILILSPEN
jgi:hypothetical protein